MFRNNSLTLKLMIPTVLLCLVAGVVGWMAYQALGRVTESYSKIATQSLPDIVATSEMFLNYRQVRIDLRTLGLPGLPKDDAERAVKGVSEAIAAFEAAAEHYEKDTLNASEDEKKIYGRVKTAWVDFKDVGNRVLTLHNGGTEQDKRQMLAIFLKDCPEAAKIFRAAIGDLTDFQRKHAATLAASSALIATQAAHSILWAILGGLSTGLMAALFAGRSASGLVLNISRVAQRLAQGANQVGSVAGHLQSTSQTLSSGAVEQAAALQETTAAVEETSAMVARSAENAKRSKDSADHSKLAANRGKEAVTEVLGALEQISDSNVELSDQVQLSNREMAEILKVIEEIGSKTKVINDIVFQTKLLSFNASVEAARAGEHGKGFAVVAEEIGNLAQMSGNSAKEISTLLDVSIRRVNDMVAATSSKVDQLVAQSKEKMDRGNQTAKNCEDALNEIVTDVSLVGELVAEISSASQEQANGMAEVNKAIIEIDKAAQQNSRASHEANTSADQLNTQVEDVRLLIGELNSLIGRGIQTPPSEELQSLTISPKISTRNFAEESKAA